MVNGRFLGAKSAAAPLHQKEYDWRASPLAPTDHGRYPELSGRPAILAGANGPGTPSEAAEEQEELWLGGIPLADGVNWRLSWTYDPNSRRDREPSDPGNRR